MILFNENKEEARIPLLKNAANWQKILLNEGHEKSYKVIYDGIDSAVPFYLEMIDKYPNDPSYPLFLGSLYGLKSRIDLAQSNWVDLVISGARGYKYIDTARQIDSLYYDVYMPIGTLEYFLCRSSSSIQLIGKLFGMQSDCMEAIDKLEIASLNSRFSWIESRNVLSYIYLYIERDYTKALEVSSSIANQFPGHPFIRGKSIEILGNRNNAINDYKKAVEYLTQYPEYYEAKELLQTPISEIINSTKY